MEARCGHQSDEAAEERERVEVNRDGAVAEWLLQRDAHEPVVSGITSLKSRSGAKVEVEQSAKARAGSDVAWRAIVVAHNRARLDQPPREPMVVTLRVAMLDVFAQEITKGPRAEDHKVIEIFCPDRSDKPFGGGLRLMLDTQFVGPTYRF